MVRITPTFSGFSPYTHQAEQLEQAAQKVYAAQLSRSTSGNLSLRTDQGMLITPSGLALEEVALNNICHIDDQGHDLEFERPFKPSSEWLIHRAVYQARPDVQAVIHAHPLHATLLAACHRTFEAHLIAESAYYLGDVPLVPYCLPGSEALANAIYHAVKTSDCLLLANHGTLVVGKTLRDAFYRLELLETMAAMQIKALTLPCEPQWLNRDQLAEINALKAQAVPAS